MSKPARHQSWFRPRPNEILISWPKVGTFLVGKGGITVRPVFGVEDDLLRLFILGPALSLLLHLRGRLVLHAGAVAVDDSAVVIMGESGSGKSSLCAALYLRGHTAVADDVTGVRETDTKRWVVSPSFPEFKLWPDVALTLGYLPETLPRIHSQQTKRSLSTTGRFPTAPLPVRRIYVLAKSVGPTIEQLQPKEALIELIRHSYCAQVLDSSDAARHFLRCGSLAKEISVRRLRRMSSLPTLCQLAELVEQDLASSVLDCPAERSGLAFA
jgi:hypothetical protein